MTITGAHFFIVNCWPMFYNYLKIAVRNLLKHRLFTIINISGLAFGLAAFLLINEYTRFEKSYDSFFDNSDNIYRLSTIQVTNGEVGVKDAMTWHPAAKALQEELPEIEASTVTYKFNQLIFRNGESSVQEKNVISADADFFEIFDYEILRGAAEGMLDEPNSIVLTESKARFYFGDEDPLGKSLEILSGFNRAFKVTGVIKDIPENTHYKFNILLSNESIKERMERDGWNGFNYYSFVKLDEQADFGIVSNKVEALSKKFLGGSSLRFNLYPIRDIYLKSDFTFEPGIPGSAKAVSFLSIIAIFILIIAWVNYINLSTARAVDRAKEVGLRKVIGAYKTQLIFQFLLEAVLVNFLAALLALLVAELALPYYHQLLGKEINQHVWNSIPFLQSLVIFFVLGTIISGLYPSLVLSGFKPVEVIKGKYRSSKSGAFLRKGLVVVQFTVSIVLIAGTLIVYRQVQFMQGKNLGINTDYVVGFPVPSVEENEQKAHDFKVEDFRESLRKHASIETVSCTSNLPGGNSSDINSSAGDVRIVGLTDKVEGTFYQLAADDHFIDAVDLEILNGRNFDRKRAADTAVVMVNETFLNQLNIADAEKVVNEYIQFGEEENNKFQIIGVVKDFNRTSLKSNVEPTIIFPSFNSNQTLVELHPDTYQEGLAYLTKAWQEYFPDAPLEYTFLDDRFAALYEHDKTFGQVFGTFSILAIFIATLGLFGLSSFMSVQRTVEVGVRKVLGASVTSIVGIFYKDFLVLLVISCIISMPAIYYIMNLWLENYAYRIDFPWILCASAFFTVAIFALLTVGYQIYKVAILDPVRTLKYE